MVRWAAKWLFWFFLKWAITLGCALTLQNVLHQEEGYLITTPVLFLGTFLFVAIIKLWTFDASASPSKKGWHGLNHDDI